MPAEQPHQRSGKKGGHHGQRQRDRHQQFDGEVICARQRRAVGRRLAAHQREQGEGEEGRNDIERVHEFVCSSIAPDFGLSAHGANHGDVDFEEERCQQVVEHQRE